MTFLRIEKVSKTFGGLRAIADLSLGVERGEIFGLIGPNGAGKTTVFNVVTGVYPPDAGGAVFLVDRPIQGQRPFRIAGLGVARTFQNIRVFSEMTVLDNVLVSAHRSRTSGLWSAVFRTRKFKDEEALVLQRALELLELFGLRALSLERARNLPYGSQRKLEIARAMMLQPELLLLDEPAAGMNTTEADGLNAQIRWLRDQFKLTIVLVEHNMRVVMGVCDRIHVMDHGETIAEGNPQEIRTNPAVIAAYLGQEVGHG